MNVNYKALRSWLYTLFGEEVSKLPDCKTVFWLPFHFALDWFLLKMKKKRGTGWRMKRKESGRIQAEKNMPSNYFM